MAVHREVASSLVKQKRKKQSKPRGKRVVLIVIASCCNCCMQDWAERQENDEQRKHI
jgi:hypothetical protein